MLHDALPPELRRRENDCCYDVVSSFGKYLVLLNFGRSMYLGFPAFLLQMQIVPRLYHLIHLNIGTSNQISCFLIPF